MQSLKLLIQRAPKALVLLWFLVFFADVANLDDLILSGKVAHCEESAALAITSAVPSVTLSGNAFGISTQSAVPENIHPYTLFDIDSPALAPVTESEQGTTISFSDESTVQRTSVAYTRFLYIIHNSLLI